LYIKIDDKWSEAIPGTGGSSFVTKEKNGLYMSDECFKMALTDAISVACKALGIGADVYWDKDKTKYTMPVEVETKYSIPFYYCQECKAEIVDTEKSTVANTITYSRKHYKKDLCPECMKKLVEAEVVK
jgi:uncharacterized protein with PIN domain